MWIKKSDKNPPANQLIVMWYVDPGKDKRESGWVGTAAESGIWNYATHWMPLDPPTK